MSTDTNLQNVVKPLTPENAKAVIDWIKSSAIPIKTVEAENGLEDLQPLKEILNNVRVVGLGEATHGTREFFQVKHRIFEFLVKEMGFTLFGIETTYIECLDINNYVLNGVGNIDEVIAGQGFWIYNTQEITDIVRWMRKYNETVPDEKKVRFYGFDTQRYARAFPVMSEYLGKVDPEFEHGLDALYEEVDQICKARVPREQKFETRDSTIDKILRIIGHLNIHRFKFIKSTSEEAFDKVMTHARCLYEVFDMHTTLTWSTRDYYMAQNSMIILDEAPAGSKMVLWAHNAHLAVDKTLPFSIMGRELRKAYGDAYYSVGFLFSEGGFQAVDCYDEAIDKENNPDNRKREYQLVKDHYVDSTGDGMEQYFLQSDIPLSLIDLRSAPREGPIADFLDFPQKSFMRGSHHAGEPPPNWNGGDFTDYAIDHSYVPRAIFDGLLYIRRTTPARMNKLPPASK